MRKKPLILLLALICIFAAVSISLAVPNYTDRSRNVITTGSVDIQIQEDSLAGGFALNGQITNEGIVFSDVMPSVTCSKVVTISNASEEPCWLRVKVELSVKNPDAGVAYSPQTLVIPNFNTAEWSKGDDGFFYFNEVLGKNMTTAPLFTEVLFAPAMGNEYAGKEIQMQIVAQAVQQKNNAADSVFLVQGWPEDGGAG